ncbi:ArsC family reductase [Agaribacter marinus]|uniref:Arsenate reductase n=1 Tax=Agaribacter marinus TaxID=1431249 RepID=A0AA37SY16_9ALTE|nr:ArsC family reductase [Agaribacter marinus]GLR70215.1 arsenate reductase [Agaribacter marinus]
MAVVYGIPNCDTIKKARKWLTDNNVEYDFHDYKKQGVNEVLLKRAIEEFGVDIVVNKRGTTYRQLPQETKDNLNAENAIAIVSANPSMIKRPIIDTGKQLLIGFNANEYAEVF